MFKVNNKDTRTTGVSIVNFEQVNFGWGKTSGKKKTNSGAKLANSFHATNLFLYPLKTSENQKTRGFLMFSGGIKREQWHKLG